jgi:hypothetical protein
MPQGKSNSKRVLTCTFYHSFLGTHQVSQLLVEDPNALETHHPMRLTIKPPLPNPNDPPLMGIKSDKDYVVSNAVEVIIAAPKNVCADRTNYLMKADYGKIPKYMKKIRKELEIERYRDEKLKQEQQESLKSKRRVLSIDERRSLLASLKERWNNVNKEYQQMTHMTVLDTLSKVQRKEAFEKELDQIEKDIALFDRPEGVDILVDLES